MKHLYFILVFIIFYSCVADSTKETKYEKYLKEHINKIMPTLDKCYSNVIILPGTGCSGCITVAENFFKDNYKNPEHLFILTSITSLKILNHKVGVYINQLPNIILDYENVYSRSNKLIYPAVIKYNCKKGEVESIFYQKPGSDAFNKI